MTSLHITARRMIAIPRVRTVLAVVIVSLIASVAGVSGARADSGGTVGTVTFLDQNFYCTYNATMSPYGTIAVQGVAFSAPRMYAAPGYASQYVGWRIRMYRLFSDGSIQFAKASSWSYGIATPTTPATLQSVSWSGSLVYDGNYVVVVDLDWFNASGYVSGWVSGWWKTFFNSVNGFGGPAPYCVL